MSTWTTARIRHLPELARDRIVFITSYYDGPLAGLIDGPDGRLARFVLADDSDFDDRTLAVYPMTDAEAARELAAKALFEAHLGTHWSRTGTYDTAVDPNVHDVAGYAVARAAADLDDSEWIPGDDDTPIAWVRA